jgi:hypothetical protein
MANINVVVHSVSVNGLQNIRNWFPADPADIDEFIVLHIGQKGKKGADEFIIRITTPKALQNLADINNVVVASNILIMKMYDLDVLLRWIDCTVAKCAGKNWNATARNLTSYFAWEYENYTDGLYPRRHS